MENDETIRIARAKLTDAKKELETIDSQLEQLERESADLQRKKEKLETVVETLEAVFDAEKQAAWNGIKGLYLSFQECCYRVLVEAEEDELPLDAEDIVEKLGERVDTMRYADPIAAVHRALRKIPDRVRSKRDGRIRVYEPIRGQKVDRANTAST